MSKGRIEAFSDGVLAILITIMVLELRTPGGEHLSDLRPLVPVLIAYVLSFMMVGIYWVNHHHLFQVVERIDGRVLWANLFLLFALSLVPFGTAWVGSTEFAPVPVTVYGVALLAAAAVYFLLVQALLRIHGPSSQLARAIGNDRKGKLSAVGYLAAIAVGPWIPYAAWGIYVVVALAWVVPDVRITRILDRHEHRP
ncbi:MAG: TMEM175 family protein [Dehalococcoidia bacterium]|nr:TMEM175 family protein [Dehalococcoidia bacterium]